MAEVVDLAARDKREGSHKKKWEWEEKVDLSTSLMQIPRILHDIICNNVMTRIKDLENFNEKMVLPSSNLNAKF
jgi:hypothetical protein